MIKHRKGVLAVAITVAALCIFAQRAVSAMAESQQSASLSGGSVIVHPKFGGQIIGYDIDRDGSEGLLAEAFAESGGKSLVALEAFDQRTGAITKVIAKEDHTLDDYVVQGLDANHLGLALFQHAVNGKFENRFLTINPLNAIKFTGRWTPPLKQGYFLGGISVTQGTPEVAAYQHDFNVFNTFVFSSDVAKNSFGRQISLQSLINATGEFFTPLIALDNKNNQAVLADSLGCPEKVCIESIALVNLATGKIREFTNNLGIGTVNGLAVDPTTAIACTTTLIDQGVEFYDLTNESGFEIQIPNSGSGLQAGLDVEFDPLDKLILVSQWTTGNVNDPQPQVYVYDEKGNLTETVSGLQRIPISPALIAINPHTRTGFLPVIVEPQNEFLELQSFSY